MAIKIIETTELTKYYGTVRGIENVSLSVNKGEIFGFIGPNGAGKSTTIRTLLGLIFPTSGEAKIFGKDAIKEGPSIRASIGYLPSEVFYYDKMKVLDLLKYSASFYPKAKAKRLYELSEIMSLNLNRRIEDLSYGNKKKVGIVQGLLHEPELIILDEPTSGLDPLMQAKFFELIQEENRKGATVFFSSHILSEVQHLCDRVGIIKDGIVIKTEDIETLRKEQYKRITLKSALLANSSFDLEGIKELKANEDTLSFYYNGELSVLLQAIAAIPLEDCLIEDPTLEEIFMHYYR